MAKIGICGAHGTGKSTLCHQLLAHLKRQSWDIGLVPEVARVCPFSLSIDQSPDDMVRTLIWLMNAQQNAEIEAMSHHEHIICDRTAIDRVAYSHVCATPSIYAAMVAWAATWLKYSPYECVLKTFANPSYLTSDRIRNTNAAFQATVDEAIARALHDLSVDHHALPEQEGDVYALSIVAGCLSRTSPGEP